MTYLMLEQLTGGLLIPLFKKKKKHIYWKAGAGSGAGCHHLPPPVQVDLAIQVKSGRVGSNQT